MPRRLLVVEVHVGCSIVVGVLPTWRGLLLLPGTCCRLPAAEGRPMLGLLSGVANCPFEAVQAYTGEVHASKGFR